MSTRHERTHTSPRAIIMAALAAMMSLGCAHDPRSREQAFTDDWAYQRRRDAAERPPVEELVIVGGEQGARASVKLDDRGRPYLNFWKKRGLSADLDVDHDEIEVGVKYEREWGGGKNEQPRPIPEGHKTLP